MSPAQRGFPHLVIRASAGTGKTFQLANRFLGLVAAGEPADSILATTFTRKAAGEILARVFVRIAEAAADAEKLDELARQIERCLSRSPAVPGLVGPLGPPLAPAPRLHARQFLHPDRAEFQPRAGAGARLADRRRGVRLATAIAGGTRDPRRPTDQQRGETGTPLDEG